MAQLDWEDACLRVRDDDGLPCRDVGAWSEDKLFVWHKYIQTTTSAMVGKPAWKAGLAYVDLFAGPGVCRVRETGRRLPGSPLIALMAPKPFEVVALVEKDARLAEACRKRTSRIASANAPLVIEGDANVVVPDIVKLLPRGALTLAFIDPEGLDVHWSSVSSLAGAGRVDLLILFADAYDAVRNLDNFLSGSDDRLDRMMGPKSQWKDRVRQLPNWEGNTLREFFADEYIGLLKSQLGYVAAGTKTISGPSGPLYRLIYASKHPRGLDFWNKVDFKDRRGQAGLFGP